jgi:hypothetical protein
MNERIRQLAEQAGATVITTHGMEHVVDGCYVIGPARLEKFAESIVQMCANIVRSRSLPDSYSEACLADIADELEELFGVKND